MANTSAVALVLLACVLCVSAQSSSSSSLQPAAQVTSTGGYPAKQTLTADAKGEIVVKKATCPFIGSAVAVDVLSVYGSTTAPLGRVEEVVAAGNSGGGTLGYVLQLFALGNHARFVTNSSLTPLGFFAFDFPASQGSHPGHSGILQGDWRRPNTGRFSDPDFQRLVRHAGADRVLSRKEVGQFIAENLHRDPNSKVAGGRLLVTLAADLAKVVGKLGELAMVAVTKGSSATAEEVRSAAIAITKLTGEENLVGSAGEFGLLFAFLELSPKTKNGDIHVDDVKMMFQDKRLPAGWESWKKSATTWITSTTALVKAVP